MELLTLRRRNKEILVDYVFDIFLPETEEREKKKNYWVERLLEGYEVQDFIQEVKQRKAALLVSTVDLPSFSSDSIGSVHVVEKNVDLYAGLKVKLQVRIFNYKSDAFQTTPEQPLFVAYHWYCSNGEVYEFDGVRTPLAAPIEQGQELEMSINLTPPAEPGDYQLLVTMVHEGRCWMEDIGLDVQRLNMTVQDYDGRGLSRHAFSIFKQLHAAEQEVLH